MRMKYLSIKRLAWLCMAALSAPVFTSCDMMTEDREDCPIGLYLNFKYDYNLERADMFNDHVGAVDVYVFDQDGKYVTKQSETNIGSSMPLADPTYTMHMDLDPGKYQFIVLAGQNTYAEQMEAGRARFARHGGGAGGGVCREAYLPHHLAHARHQEDQRHPARD